MFINPIYKLIPLVYNLALAMLWQHPENVELEKVQVVHYCAAGSKPWRYTEEEANMQREDIKMLVKKWWDVYNDESLDFKPEDAVALAGQGIFMANMPEAAESYIPAPSAS